jgi:multidrug efflux pump subunit AcrA (membrane-fusion protein)
MTRRLLLIAAVVVLAGAGGVVWARAGMPGERDIPTARVQRGRVQVTVHALGDLRAGRAMQMFVPTAGGSLTIIRLASSGSAVKANDVIVEFDPSEQEFALEQARYDLALAGQEIIKAEAEAAVQAAEDQVALLKARFEVRRAELEASTNELVGAIVAKQNLLLLEEARQKLAQLEHDVKSHAQSSLASRAALGEKRNKAQLAVSVAERNIDNLRIRAPFDGYVTLRPNMMAFGGIVFGGAVMPEYRVGDSTSPGQLIADLVDTSRVEITSKLSERDRANVASGQTVSVAVDAVPDTRLDARVRSVSGVASRQMFEGGTRRFDIAFDVAGDTSRIRPGVSAALQIVGPTFDDALYLPRAAVFDVSGKQSVYVRTANGFEPKEIKVRAFTDTVAVVEGLEANVEVALINPASRSTPQRPAAPPSPRQAG